MSKKIKLAITGQGQAEKEQFEHVSKYAFY